jgi:hypothetical protein
VVESVDFLMTAGAFLLLANLGSAPATGGLIPRAEPAETETPESTLTLSIPEEQLEDLERRPGQKLTLDVENSGSDELAIVDLALDITSENTVRPHARSYQASVEDLSPAVTATVEFEIDLSSPTMPADDREGGPGSANQSPPREILEARATTPDGYSTFKTAVLAP